MKYVFLITIFSFLFSLNATEINSELYPYIQPISVEKLSTPISVNITIKDADGDGIENSIDACPGTLADVKVDSIGCKLLHDSDNDGVANRDDKCSKTPEGAEVDTNGCEPDADKDGVADTIDECPDTSNDFVVDSVGCPQTAVLKVNFQTGKAIILKNSFNKKSLR